MSTTRDWARAVVAEVRGGRWEAVLASQVRIRYGLQYLEEGAAAGRGPLVRVSVVRDDAEEILSFGKKLAERLDHCACSESWQPAERRGV
jgi:hypothetical protein